MYETYFGFHEKPFSLIPDPDFLYLSEGHRAALSLLEYGITEQTGFVVISGEVGSGKTTLVRRLLTTVSEDVVVGLITNTHPSFGELLQWICLAFDLDHREKGKVELYQGFLDFLIEQYAASRRTVLVIDEAQNLSPEALEELRMLSNINADKDYLIQLILLGQPELLAKLRRPDLRQFVQRIGVDYHLGPLTLADTLAYIRHRLTVAGGDPQLFDDYACAAVHYYAGGVPRLANVLCDMALVFAYAEDRPQIDIDIVMEVAATRRQSGLAVFRADPENQTRDEARRTIIRTLLATYTPQPLQPETRRKDYGS
ncbi:MAG TPA: AAA family ATPase [Rhodospirillales bacterium]|nr:AAA family ATPase [Rhodospirillales bacterium]